MSNNPIRVTVWNEYRHEKVDDLVRQCYPAGIHAAIADGLRPNQAFVVRTATLDEPEHGLTADVLANTDVLVWWGHMAHGEVKDDIVERVHARVMACLLYTSPSPRDRQKSRMPSSA